MRKNSLELRWNDKHQRTIKINCSSLWILHIICWDFFFSSDILCINILIDKYSFQMGDWWESWEILQCSINYIQPPRIFPSENRKNPNTPLTSPQINFPKKKIEFPPSIKSLINSEWKILKSKKKMMKLFHF
jgi:hypothetical protein